MCEGAKPIIYIISIDEDVEMVVEYPSGQVPPHVLPHGHDYIATPIASRVNIRKKDKLIPPPIILVKFPPGDLIDTGPAEQSVAVDSADGNEEAVDSLDEEEFNLEYLSEAEAVPTLSYDDVLEDYNKFDIIINADDGKMHCPLEMNTKTQYAV